MTLATGKDRHDGRRVEGDMEFVSDTGLWVPVSGTKATGKAPLIQSDGTVGWEAVATQAYVDAKVAGLSWKQAVRAATTAAGTLATSFENGDVIDGVTLATGDRILIKNQAAGAENGIYVVNASGAPTRATDADAAIELVNATMYVSEGTTNADTQWTQTANAPITVGSTALVFAQLASGVSVGAQTANTVHAGPTSGGSATPTFRALVAADIPSLDAAKITTGVLAIGRLATGSPDGSKFVRDDGTLAVPAGTGTSLTALYTTWDPLIPDASPTSQTDEFTSDTSANYTLIYTGDAGVAYDFDTTARGALYIEATSSSFHIKAGVKALPAGDFTMHFGGVLNGFGDDSAIGIVLSSNNVAGAGTQTLYAIGSEGNVPYAFAWSWQQWGNTATGNTNNKFVMSHGSRFVRLRRVSGVYTASHSADGRVWRSHTTANSAPSGTPAYFGWGFLNYTGSIAHGAVDFLRYYSSGTQMTTGALRTVYG